MASDYVSVKKAKNQVLPYDDEAVKVVVGLGQTKQVKYYALVNEHEEVCETRSIGADLTFFFAEYETGATSQRERAKEWALKIKNSAVSTSSNGQTSAPATQLTSRKDMWHHHLQIPDTKSLANHISLYLNTFAATKNAELLKHLQDILEESDSDLKFRFPKGNVQLHKFLSREVDFSVQDAVDFVAEAKVSRSYAVELQNGD